MTRILSTAILLTALVLPGVSFAGDAAAGKASFGVCVSCHGEGGKGNKSGDEACHGNSSVGSGRSVSARPVPVPPIGFIRVSSGRGNTRSPGKGRPWRKLRWARPTISRSGRRMLFAYPGTTMQETRTEPPRFHDVERP